MSHQAFTVVPCEMRRFCFFRACMRSQSRLLGDSLCLGWLLPGRVPQGVHPVKAFSWQSDTSHGMSEALNPKSFNSLEVLSAIPSNLFLARPFGFEPLHPSPEAQNPKDLIKHKLRA